MTGHLRTRTYVNRLTRGVALSVSLSVLGCASVPKDAGFQDVQSKLAPRLPQTLHWNRDTEEDAAALEQIETLLAQPLTLAAAIQIGLLNNPDLQTMYESLGVAQADLVQAGLLENPVFAAGVRFPDHDREGSRTTTVTREAGGGIAVSRSSESSILRNNIEFALVQNFLQLLTIPMRKQMASAQFEKTKLMVAHEVLHFVAETKHAWYEYVAAVQTAELLDTVAIATEAASDFAVRQYEAGNLSRLEMSRENSFHAEALLETADAHVEKTLAGERLNRLLGVWQVGAPPQLAVVRLEQPPKDEVRAEGLESFAIANRLDLAAAVKELEMLAFGVKTTRRWRWRGLLDLSVSTEREADGLYVTGPALELELPIFDQGQGELAIARSELRAGGQRVSSLAIDVRSETRQAWTKLSASRDVVDYYERVLLPVHQRIMDESQLHYNAMLIGVYDLLLDKQRQIDAAKHYVKALLDYWRARTELETALGGSLPEDEVMHTEAMDASPPAPHESMEPMQDAMPAENHNHKEH